jgi:hypothetical protein
MIRYHDEEWGVPVRNDRGLFEFLILEGAQAVLAAQVTTGDFTEACGRLKSPPAIESCYRPQSRVRVH